MISDASFSAKKTTIDLDGYRLLKDSIHPVKWAKREIEPLLGIELDPWQKDFLRNDAKRICLNCHRQSGKSLICAIKAIHRSLLPNQTVVIISPSQRQSSQLHHKIRKLLREMGIIPKVDNATSTELNNGSRIISLPGSPWTVRGFTANIVIVDEAAGVDEEVFAAVSPMLLTTDGTLIILSTPQGQKGFYWEAYNDKTTWSVHEIKVSDNPRMQSEEKKKMLENEKRSLGSRMFSQEYECKFLGEADGGIFKKEWILYSEEQAPKNARRVRYWDCAITSQKKADLNNSDPDWTVGIRMAVLDEGKIIIEDVQRFRVGPMEKQNLIRNTAKNDGLDCEIVIEQEGGSAGAEVIDLYSRLLSGYAFRGDHPTGPKQTRAMSLSAAMERGDVFLFKADWNRDFIDELAAFPLGNHDDQVDSASGAYRFISEAPDQDIVFF